MLRLIIENFKSIEQLDLELGRVNLFIGENGCGKTTILEALGMAAAASAHGLSTASLRERGIRVADPTWMRSAFSPGSKDRAIEVGLIGADAGFITSLEHDNSPYGRWVSRIPKTLSEAIPVEAAQDALDSLQQFDADTREAVAKLWDLPPPPSSAKDAPEVAQKWIATVSMFLLARNLHLSDYLTYAPREDVLRDLARDSDVEPIGIHGEGLFKLLQVLDSEGQLSLVKEQLALLGWFDDLSVASGVNPSSRALQIRDVFIEGDTPFDQRSANEGFLFVLLYASLLISKYTPRFFAVDNVDTALNPKLCARTVKMFAELSKTYDRRVLLTAHNPGALDGLDLHDDEQRLFVVYRNTEGRTRARRILPTDLPPGQEPVRLSEAFLRGYLGALPTNF